MIVLGGLALGPGCAVEDADPAPNTACDEERMRECMDGGVQFCGAQCSQGSDGLGGSCNDAPTWSRCVMDPVCVPGETESCGNSDGECAGAEAHCLLDRRDDGAPAFDGGDCFC